MSIIFGIRRSPGDIVSDDELSLLARATERYALDGTSVKSLGQVGMGFQPYYTHSRSTHESKPITDLRGNLLTLDGRLDNCHDLCGELGLDAASTGDSQIVLAAFLHWGENCFSRLVGDWAIALWSASEQSLYLARDHAGTRTLYFQTDKGALRWSTHLETFVTGGVAVRLDHDYAACFLASQPTRDLTPYEGIRAVLPAHYVTARRDTISRKSHWQWMSQDRIRLRKDTEYEEQFLSLFKQSVERRTGPGAPILAQLSGGMDSTSIVCVSDHVRRLHDPAADILDTLSFYDDSEPSWNEKPYFSVVEAKRGKVGIHMEISLSERTFEPHDSSYGAYLIPGADSSAIHQERNLHDATWQKGYRVVLSGIGGDEVLGGVPVASPELADYLVSRNLNRLLRRSIDWCLIDRSPLISMLFDTVKYTSLLYLNPYAQEKAIPPWIPPTWRRRCAEIADQDITRGSRRRLTPASIDNGLAWWSVMESLPHLFPRLLSRPEYRYPYLDRDLVNYLFSIPREQLLRPGRRRSLMRRALTNIVPIEILERRRKAFQLRAPLLALQINHTKLETLLAESLIGDYGLIDTGYLRNALELTSRGVTSQWWQPILRAIAFELWLRTAQTGISPTFASVRAHEVSPA